MLKVHIYDKDDKIIYTLTSSATNRHGLELAANEYIYNNHHAVSMGAVYESVT